MGAKKELPYNSAMKSCPAGVRNRELLEEVAYFENQHGAVFFHDMNEPFSKDELRLIDNVSCVYAQLSWPQGMKIFAERANYKQKGTHKEYLLSVKALVNRLRKPTFIVCSESHAQTLRPDRIREIKLYKVKTFIACWRDYIDEKHWSADEISIALAQKYPSVYDFSCGYGRSIREFEYFVGSDIDKRCLGYIKAEILEKKARN